MRMLRTLGLLVFVVFVMAFASGCGGGGGGTTTTTEEPPVVTPEPEPTELSDAEKIATDIATVAEILGDAQTAIQTTSSTASDIALSLDVTEGQLESAAIQNRQALDALNAIVASVTSVNAASTPAQSGAAVITARAAYARLVAAQSSLTALLDEIESPTTPTPTRPVERPTDDIQATGGSSLIRHLRVNEAIVKGVVSTFSSATVDALTVSAITATNSASFPANMTSKRGERTVTVMSRGLEFQTTTLSGPATFRYGFDVHREGSFPYFNAYTDIDQTKDIRRLKAGNNLATDADEDYDHTYYETEEDVEDADYLLLGLWLTAEGALTPFAHGSQDLDKARAGYTECNAIPQNADNTCVDAADFHLISSFVDPGDDPETATYRGHANGVYAAVGNTGYFDATVELNAVFRNGTTSGISAEVSGSVSNIMATGISVSGDIQLQQADISVDNISNAFSGLANGVVDGESYTGHWKGQFFGQRVGRGDKVPTSDPGAVPVTTTTTFKPEAPGSVAGTFFATKQTGERDAAYIGAFGAHRP